VGEGLPGCWLAARFAPEPPVQGAVEGGQRAIVHDEACRYLQTMEGSLGSRPPAPPRTAPRAPSGTCHGGDPRGPHAGGGRPRVALAGAPSQRTTSEPMWIAATPGLAADGRVTAPGWQRRAKRCTV